MRFTVVTTGGTGLPIAQRLMEEGHSVLLLVHNGSKVGEGLVPIFSHNGLVEKEQAGLATLSNIKSASTKDSLIIFTDPGFGEIAEGLVKMGYMVLGAGMFHDNLMNQENFTRMVNTIHDVQCSREDPGLNCVIEGWFNGEDFVYPIFGAIQEYAFMAGNVGPIIDCAGATYFAFKNFRPMQFQRSLLKIKPVLKKLNFKGPISVDMVGDNVIRYTAGFRFDTMYVFLSLLKQSFSALVMDVMRGMVKQMQVGFDYGVTMRASIPPYPHGVCPPPTEAIGDFGKWRELGIAMTGVRQEAGMLYPASYNGMVGSTVCTAPTIKEAQAQSLRVLSQIYVMGLQFRVDIATVALKTIGPILSYGMEKKSDVGTGSEGTEGGSAGEKALSEKG